MASQEVRFTEVVVFGALAISIPEALPRLEVAL